MRRMWVALAALALIGAACGGDDDDGGAAGESTPTVAEADDTTAGDDAQPDEPEAGDDGEPEQPEPTDEPADEPEPEPEDPAVPAEGATAMVNGEELVFPDAVVCVTINDALGGSWFSADRNLSIDVDLPPPDWETSGQDWSAPSVRIDDERDPSAELSWRAGGEVLEAIPDLPEQVAVTDYEVSNRAATGTATVVELNGFTRGEETIIDITFSVACGE